MPLKYWNEAFLTALYLINRLPSKVIQSQTPMEHLFSNSGDYSLLHIFGCACWLNLRPYNKHKLSFRSKQCAFLGYSNLHKRYKCLDISTSYIYIYLVILSLTRLFFLLLHCIQMLVLDYARRLIYFLCPYNLLICIIVRGMNYKDQLVLILLLLLILLPSNFCRIQIKIIH
jgi:hypothetical protein